MKAQLNIVHELITLDIPSVVDFPQMQKSLNISVNRAAQMFSKSSNIASKAIFSRVADTKDFINQGISTIFKFFLYSNFDARSKAAVALALLLATTRAVRAICETIANPANFALHFPTFFAMFLALAYCVKNQTQTG